MYFVDFLQFSEKADSISGLKENYLKYQKRLSCLLTEVSIIIMGTTQGKIPHVEDIALWLFDAWTSDFRLTQKKQIGINIMLCVVVAEREVR